jgi:hypothetical protein
MMQLSKLDKFLKIPPDKFGSIYQISLTYQNNKYYAELCLQSRDCETLNVINSSVSDVSAAHALFFLECKIEEDQI